MYRRLYSITQVKDVARAGILVGVHGAGMTNAMFLPSYAAIIEIFPYKWWPDMYRQMAHEGIKICLGRRARGERERGEERRE